ncbi:MULTISPECIES: calcium-binding protein [unclassified Leptolyngbya]|uniref:calcium-binding protein n=1 Tax=unclassified Leptolyngbya TaxID=2650499 RepID=UPI00168259D3|nr:MULTISPECIES: calcium-binding protein [unclassified Leptolyngbya]MBD1910902.1 hypothetical protein [Leptolyngbya sp. FACHB-8]MBD2153703.1 hypothetical protein [Leptolyngbya sp. FACHB-16]
MLVTGTNSNENNVTRPQLVGSEQDDQMYGLGGEDILYGLGGNDLLDGGSGIDTMYGGAGNDTYVVTGGSLFIDSVVEQNGAGNDTVHSYVSYTLGNYVENLELQSLISLPGQPAVNNNLNGTGNNLQNRITGNIGNNVLQGLGGADTLLGGSGSDTLYGGSEADLLDGGFGADFMYGGTGSDTYYVDNVGDVVADSSSASSGTDRVILKSVLNYTLSDYVENLELVSNTTTAQSGRGNALNNQISGGLGNDTLRGLGGDDNLYGHTGSDNLLSGTGSDRLVGTFNGRGEIDRLTGGAGNDTFVLGQALTPTGGNYYIDNSFLSSGTTDYALITDFAVGQDKIQLINNASQYIVQNVTLGSVSGAGIYIKGNQLAVAELIGVVQGVSAANLNLSGASFTYDQYQPPQ